MYSRLAFLFGLVACTLGMAAHGRHAVHVACELRGNQLVIEAFYDGGLPAQEAKVEVVDAANTVVAAGRTDDKGMFRTARPQPGTYTVRVDAGAGHRTKVQLTLSEEEQSLSAGTSRAEATQFPWMKVALGLGIIVLVCAGLWLLTATTKNRSESVDNQGE